MPTSWGTGGGRDSGTKGQRPGLRGRAVSCDHSRGFEATDANGRVRRWKKGGRGPSGFVRGVRTLVGVREWR